VEQRITPTPSKKLKALIESLDPIPTIKAKGFELWVSKEGRCILRNSITEKAIRMQSGPLQVEPWTVPKTREFPAEEVGEAGGMVRSLLLHARLCGATEEALEFLQGCVTISPKDLEAIRFRSAPTPRSKSEE
jgi:hypothetical protein